MSTRIPLALVRGIVLLLAGSGVLAVEFATSGCGGCEYLDNSNAKLDPASTCLTVHDGDGGTTCSAGGVVVDNDCTEDLVLAGAKPASVPAGAHGVSVDSDYASSSNFVGHFTLHGTLGSQAITIEWDRKAHFD